MRYERAGLGFTRVAFVAAALLMVSILASQTADAALAEVGYGRAVVNTGSVTSWAVETDGVGSIVDTSGTGIPASTEAIIIAVGDYEGRYVTALTYKPNSSATAISATAVPTPSAPGPITSSLWIVRAPSAGALAGSYGAGGISWSVTFSGATTNKTFQYVALSGLASSNDIDVTNDTNQVRAGGNVDLTVSTTVLPLGYRYITEAVSANQGVSFPSPTFVNSNLASELAMTGNYTTTTTYMSSRMDVTYPTLATSNRTVRYNNSNATCSGWGVVVRPRYTISVSASPAVAALSVGGAGDYNAGDSATVTATINVSGSYTFVDWTEGGTSVSTSASYTFSATADRALVANFTPNSYSVTFDPNGGQPPSPSSKSVTYDSTYGTLPTPTRDGYTFAGWWTDASAGTEVQSATPVTATSNHTIYAHWTPNTYTVTFVSQGGSAPSPGTKTVTFGSAYGTLAATSRTGYDFNGWFTADVGGTLVDDTTTVATPSDHFLYAQWTPKTFTVTFDANGGTAASPGTMPVTYDAAYGTLAATTRTNYAFSGWWTDPSAGAEILSSTTVAITANQTLYAHWTPTYTVTFDSNGGASPIPMTKTVLSGSTYGALATTSRTGYTFDGWWTTQGGGSLVLDTTPVTITADQTLYAHWTALQYTVTFDANGGSAATPGTKVVTYDSTYGALATTSRTGYAFGGWWTAASGGTQVTSGTSVTLTADQTLFAHWTASSYLVTFDANGGSAATPATRTVTYDSTYGSLATTSRTGYTFNGWWTDATAGTEVLTSTVVSTASAHTLYAHWTANSYLVTFVANGGGSPSPATKSVTYDAAYGALATISRTGYIFDGWWTAASGGTLVTNVTVVSTASAHSLYAHWTARTFTVTFNENGGAASSPATKVVTYDATYGLLATTTRTGYSFDGWWTAASGGTQIFDTTVVALTADQTLYAHWAATSTVTFNPNSGTTPSPTTKIVTLGWQYGTLATTTRAGYFFAGWWTAASGGSLVTDTTTVTITGDHTLYAHWSATSITVTFNANGGVAPVPATASVVYDSAYGALATTSRANYVFAGWWTDPSAGTEVTSSTIVTISSNHTLYAHWTPTYVVTFDAAGGSAAAPATTTVTFGLAYGPLATTSRTGYTFAGWWTSPNGGGVEITSATTVALTGNQTLYAKWVGINYTVIYDSQNGTSPVPGFSTVTFGSPYGTLAGTTRVGYTFSGWWTGAGGTGTEVTSATLVATAADHTLYAKWTANVYTVTFDAQGGNTPTPATIGVTYDATYGTLATTSRVGYSFDGWWTLPTGGVQIQSDTAVSITEDQTLYAHWTGNTYTVTFDAQGGLAPAPATKDVVFGSTYGALAATSMVGHYFAGWWTDPTAGTEVLSSTEVTTAGAHTLYAHWSVMAYTVTFDPQGGSTPVPAAKSVPYGSAYGELPAVTRSGYLFSGWWTDPVAGSMVTSTTLMNTAADHTLYAQWSHQLMVVVTPSSGNAGIGASYTMTATASGGFGAHHYAWKLNGAPAPYAADNRKYIIPAAAETDAGTYRVDVTDELGALASSNDVSLTVGVAVPVAGLPTLAMLLASLTAGGVLTVRRKK